VRPEGLGKLNKAHSPHRVSNSSTNNKLSISHGAAALSGECVYGSVHERSNLAVSTIISFREESEEAE
jgi:hypothetical protein